MRTRVLIADDHELVARGIERELEGEVDVVGRAANGRALLFEAQRLQPEVVILDIAMPVLNGIEAALQLRVFLPRAKFLFVTQQTDRCYVEAAFRAGAHAYVIKQSAAREIREALHAVLNGELYVSHALAKDLRPLADLRRDRPGAVDAPMTRREREVLQLVAEGKTGKEIASILSISVKTVEFHKHGITEALGLRTTAELTRYALEHGIIATHSLQQDPIPGAAPSHGAPANQQDSQSGR